MTNAYKCLVSEPSEASIIVLWGGSRRALIRIKNGTLRISLCLRGVGSFSVAIFHLDARHDRFILFFSFEVKPDQIFPGKAKVNHLFSHLDPNFEWIRPSQVRTEDETADRRQRNVQLVIHIIHWYSVVHLAFDEDLQTMSTGFYTIRNWPHCLLLVRPVRTKHIPHPIRPRCLVTGATQMVFPSHNGFLH